MYRVYFMDFDINNGFCYDKVIGVFETREDAEQYYNENIKYYKATGHMLYLQYMPA